MKHVIIGTAGHIDHGKSALTRALVGDREGSRGIDRLKEEQKRGITIELGFAECILPNGQSASIVDVPGHEKLIKHMLMGAGGMDLVLLVVAADEGFMPQTKEHLEILGLLGLKHGIVVLTKTDLVDAEWIEVVKEDLTEHLKGSFLENAPVMPVSSATGEGIEALRNRIQEMVEQLDDHTADKPFRLPVDRVFTVRGFGTVVTGTAVDGELSQGESVMIYPQEKLCKVREMQHHEVKQEHVSPGMRVALNLGNIDKKELMRGCTVAAPGSMQLTNRIAVRLQMTRDAAFSLKNASRVHFYQGTQELIGKLRLLDANILGPGESGYALIMFTEMLTARNLDKFIIRFFSPMVTVGGGQILDMQSPRLRRADEEVVRRLDRLAGLPEERIGQLVLDAGSSILPEQELVTESGLAAGTVRKALRQLCDRGEICPMADGYVAAASLNEVWSKTEEALRAFHRDEPLAEGMNLGELREKVFPAGSRGADVILDAFVQQGKLRRSGGAAALAEFSSAFSNELRQAHDRLEGIYLRAGLDPLGSQEAAEAFGENTKQFRQLTQRMLQDGTLIALDPATLVHKNAYRSALEMLAEIFREKGEVVLGDYRTRLGVSRKSALLYLDSFDAKRITRKMGDKRVVLKLPEGIGETRL